MPVRAWEGVRDQFSSRSELIAENERLKAESLLMQRRVQKLAALTEQNACASCSIPPRWSTTRYWSAS